MLPKLARKKISIAPDFSSYEGRTLPNLPLMDSPPAGMELWQKSAKFGRNDHFSPLHDAPNDAP
jgi:hypothetical protein